MKIMSIGDIHGRNDWKKYIFGSIRNYGNWRIEVDKGNKEDFADQYPVLAECDKIIFIGDYVDSFEVKNLEMMHNLHEIIHFKKTYPDKVVLLIGNHDIQYIVPNRTYTGYRPEMQWPFGELYRKNNECFQMAYWHESEMPSSPSEKKQTLWTHAGVTQGWLQLLRETIQSPEFQFVENFKDMELARIDVLLNKAWDYRLDCLFNADRDSGGLEKWAGPLWVRPRMLAIDAIKGVDQIVGHTPQKTIITFTPDDSEDTVFVIDCIEHGDGKTLIREY
jgi:predicted phosphodiesterase